MTATKSDLISDIAEENGFPQNKSAEAIETLIGLIKTKLAAERGCPDQRIRQILCEGKKGEARAESCNR